MPTGAAGTVFSLPITFPNAIFGIVASHLGSSTGIINVEATAVGLNQVRLTHNGVSAANVFYIVKGR
ncbi:hypothetical protein D3C80_2049560 [compost metagenome]